VGARIRLEKIAGGGASQTRVVQFGSKLLSNLYGRVYLSSDGGKNWQNISEGTEMTNVWCIATKGTSTIFAGDRDLWRSNDQGTTWVKLNFGSTQDIIVIGESIFALTYTKVYRSMDNGATWENFSNGINARQPVFKSMVTDGTNLYIGGTASGDTFFRSPISSAQWDSTGVWQMGNGTENLYATNKMLVAVSCRSGVFISTNQGRNWSRTRLFGGSSCPISSTIWDNNIYVSTSSVGNDRQGVWRSNDGGQNWIYLGLSVGFDDVYSLLVVGNILYAGARGDLYSADITDKSSEYSVYGQVTDRGGVANITLSLTGETQRGEKITLRTLTSTTGN
jgi:photosystem II stability/assembly factor-like uncharacterized protein